MEDREKVAREACEKLDENFSQEGEEEEKYDTVDIACAELGLPRFDLMLDEPYEKARGLSGLFYGTRDAELVDFCGEETEGISMFLTDIAEEILTVQADFRTILSRKINPEDKSQTLFHPKSEANEQKKTSETESTQEAGQGTDS